MVVNQQLATQIIYLKITSPVAIWSGDCPLHQQLLTSFQKRYRTTLTSIPNVTQFFAVSFTRANQVQQVSTISQVLTFHDDIIYDICLFLHFRSILKLQYKPVSSMIFILNYAGTFLYFRKYHPHYHLQFIFFNLLKTLSVIFYILNMLKAQEQFSEC